MWKRQDLGQGVGLRTPHYPHLLENDPAEVGWFEVISENFIEPGGRPWAVLEKMRAEVPIVCHGVSLGIGGTDPLNEEYLARIETLIERAEPAWVSDHLCWGGYEGKYAHDLLPLPYNEETLRHVCERVEQIQERLGRQFMLENVSSYLTYETSDMPEWEFLAEIARRTDCGILLDVNNIYVSSVNHDFSPELYIDSIPPEQVGQFHLAGHTPKDGWILDSHIGPVPDPVWQLYERAVRRFGKVPALIEWDDEIPTWEELVAESQRAAEIEAEILGE